MLQAMPRAFSVTTNALVLLSLWICQIDGSAPCVDSRYIRHTGSAIELDPAVSSGVINVSSDASVPNCLMLCRLRGCAVVVVMETSRLCQLVIVNDAPQHPGPPGSHVRRLVGSEAGAKVWTVKQLNELLKLRAFNVSALTRMFSNSSTGRNGSIQQAVISLTGCYRIEVAGAKGGNNAIKHLFGGFGALVAGTFNLTAGTQLAIVVGQAGGPAGSGSAGAGGGGGSFVYRMSDNYLLIAAGGGGGASFTSSGGSGEGSVNGSDSISGQDTRRGSGGANGQPGSNDALSIDIYVGGCGAGWLGKAANPRSNQQQGDRGGGLADGWIGGSAGGSNTGNGGFGGGGGGASQGTGGAGSGFSGGGAGVGSNHAGGGGGSFCGGCGCNVTADDIARMYSEHGRVALRLLAPLADNCE